jgi:hypothetical protein
MVNLLKQGRPFIICEIMPVYSLEKENGKYRYERQNELINILKDNNYVMFLIDELNLKLLKIDEIIIHGDMNRTNYVICHESEKDMLENLYF